MNQINFQKITTYWLLLAIFILSSIERASLAVDKAEKIDIQQLEEEAIKAALKRVAPSVVKIETIGGLDKVGRVLIGTGPTTGLIVSADGYIISSAFNFIQQPASILVTLPSGKRAVAKLVATDHSRKIVLLKVKSDKKLPLASLVEEKKIRVGQWALAVGRTFESSQPNMSLGIISAKRRIWNKAIQTDAKISPSNYGGPIVDIHGHVMGVLVPLSPTSDSENAGAQWYDSGIGFAIPISHIMSKLAELKKGNDLYPGLLGITLKKGGIYSQPAKILGCRPNTPAQKAGLLPGDTIIQIDNISVHQQAQLKHQIMSRYAGETLHLVVLRKKKKIQVKVKLVQQIEPYEHPYLGILPLRNSKKNIVTRFIYPNSPAAKAGVQIGDHLIQIGNQPIENLTTIYNYLSSKEPGNLILLKVRRDKKPLDLKITLGHYPTTIPDNLPPARTNSHPKSKNRPAVGEFKIKIPEFKNDCTVYVPENYHPTVAHGVVIWLHGSTTEKDNKVIERWKTYCERNDLILLLPKSAKKSKWHREEVELIRKCLDHVRSTYQIDTNRVVVVGHQIGGVMAYLVAFTNRDLIRAVAAIDAPLPNSVRIPENEPSYRLSIFTMLLKSADKKHIKNNSQAIVIDRLNKMKYPVTTIPVTSIQGNRSTQMFSAKQRALFARWIDALDKF